MSISSVMGPGWTDYACNTKGMMNPVQLIQRQSADAADEYIDLFRQAIENGADPNDNAVKLAIQSQGSMDFDELLPHDSERIIKEIQAMMNMHNNFY